LILEGIAAWTIDIIKYGVHDTDGSKNSSKIENSTFVNGANENISKINISKIFTLGFGYDLIMIVIKIIKTKKSYKKSKSGKKTLIFYY
jgi:hypothetical protein